MMDCSHIDIANFVPIQIFSKILPKRQVDASYIVNDADTISRTEIVCGFAEKLSERIFLVLH